MYKIHKVGTLTMTESKGLWQARAAVGDKERFARGDEESSRVYNIQNENSLIRFLFFLFLQ